MYEAKRNGGDRVVVAKRHVFAEDNSPERQALPRANHARRYAMSAMAA